VRSELIPHELNESVLENKSPEAEAPGSLDPNLNLLNYRRSINNGHRPIGAELEQMVIIKRLLMEVVSITIQHPLNPLYPVEKDKFQFRPLNFTQKFLNASERILWPGELLSC
jgi:hypothetical protein